MAFPKPSPFLKPTIRDRLRNPFYKLYYADEMAWSIQRELTEFPYDLVHVDTGAMAVYTHLLTAHRKIMAATDSATLVWINRLPTVTTLKENLRTRLLIHQMRKFESQLYPEYDACIVITDRDKHFIHKASPDLPIHVIPNGTDLKYFTPPAPEAEQADQLVFTGTMDYDSNVDGAEWFVKKVLPQIEAGRPTVKLQLVGRNPNDRILGLGKQSNVAVVGSVPDLRPYLAEAAVYICPLRYGAGMKNKMLEAMAMGKAIVTTTEGCSGIGGTAGREYLVADEPGAFAANVLTLLNNASQRQQLGNAARAYVQQHYSWERTAQQFHEVYCQVVTKHIAQNR